MEWVPCGVGRSRKAQQMKDEIDGGEQTGNGFACNGCDDTILGIDPEPPYCPPVAHCV